MPRLRRLREYLPAFGAVREEDSEPRIIDMSEMRIPGFRTTFNDAEPIQGDDDEIDLEDWVLVPKDELMVPDDWEMLSTEEIEESRRVSSALTDGPNVSWRYSAMGHPPNNRMSYAGKSPGVHLCSPTEDSSIARPTRGHPNPSLSQPSGQHGEYDEQEEPLAKRQRLSLDEEKQDLYLETDDMDDADDSSISSHGLDEEWEIIDVEHEFRRSREVLGEA